MSAFAGGKATAQLKEDDLRKVLAERLKGLDETLVEYCASMLMEEDFRVQAKSLKSLNAFLIWQMEEDLPNMADGGGLS